MRWGQVHSEFWRPYWKGDHDGEDTSADYKRTEGLFNAVPVPKEIKAYQGDLTDEDLKDLAKGLFWMTREIREAIDLTEGLAKLIPISKLKIN